MLVNDAIMTTQAAKGAMQLRTGANSFCAAFSVIGEKIWI